MPRGIVNPDSNICWLASCVQVLADIPSFRKALINHKFDGATKRNPIPRFLRTLRNVLLQLQEDDASPINIDSLRAAGHAVQAIYFRPLVHEDSGEHLTQIMRYVEEAGLEEEICKGFLMSDTLSPRPRSSLTTLNRTADTFDEALRRAMICDNTGAKHWIKDPPAVFTFTIVRHHVELNYPFIFNDTFCLDRFMSDRKEEVDSVNQFSEDAEAVLASWNDYQYDLRSVVVHRGHSINAGHYFVFRKVPNQRDEWYKLDDDRISIKTTNHMLRVARGSYGGTESAAALVYVRRGYEIDDVRPRRPRRPIREDSGGEQLEQQCLLQMLQDDDDCILLQKAI
ncbi:hypothetical protein PFISCL1PPCAC_4769, partial [Pristionchus fissidentatus]